MTKVTRLVINSLINLLATFSHSQLDVAKIVIETDSQVCG